MDGWMDGWMDGQTDIDTVRQAYNYIHVYTRDICGFHGDEIYIVAFRHDLNVHYTQAELRSSYESGEQSMTQSHKLTRNRTNRYMIRLSLSAYSMTDAEFPVTVKHQQHRHKLRKA
jgi:hypothetical protein